MQMRRECITTARFSFFFFLLVPFPSFIIGYLYYCRTVEWMRSFFFSLSLSVSCCIFASAKWQSWQNRILTDLKLLLINNQHSVCKYAKRANAHFAQIKTTTKWIALARARASTKNTHINIIECNGQSGRDRRANTRSTQCAHSSHIAMCPCTCVHSWAVVWPASK